GIRAFHVTGVQTCALPISLQDGGGFFLTGEEIAGDPGDVNANPIGNPTVDERFLNALVAVNMFGVFPDDCYPHAFARGDDGLNQDRKSVVEGPGVDPWRRR